MRAKLSIIRAQSREFSARTSWSSREETDARAAPPVTSLPPVMMLVSVTTAVSVDEGDNTVRIPYVNTVRMGKYACLTFGRQQTDKEKPRTSGDAGARLDETGLAT